MRSSVFLSTCLAATSIAAPTFLGDVTRDLAGIAGSVSSEFGQMLNSASSCDASKISLPTSSGSDLPSPSGQKPLYVAIGRGTQNYTCASSSSDSKPEAVGAVADLFDVTCMAANDSDKLADLPKIALKIPDSSDIASALSRSKMDLLGHHYFQGSTPVFNLDTTSDKQDGIAFTKVQKKLDAPSDSEQGDNGAVEWLYLSTVDGTVGDFESVYRISTAGGAPPQTCENVTSNIEVQYAANYFFFRGS